jgi:hypothetical protein
MFSILSQIKKENQIKNLEIFMVSTDFQVFMSMDEIANAVNCYVYEIGRMIIRVINFLDLRGNDWC